MAENKKLLNLSGELTARLAAFLASEKIEIVPPELLNDIQEVSYILIRDLESFDELNIRYDTIKNHISIISLTPIRNPKDFLLKGGRGVIDESWLDSFIGTILLKKMFQDAGTVHIDEMFGNEFARYETCKLSDHLRLGYYSDIISLDAFEHDYNIVSIRGFLYNVIYYFSYLKQAGIGVSPFEIEYAYNGEVFVANLHLSVKNFVAEYILDCFGEVSTTDPLKYLLKNAYLLADNTDITYIENPSKLVVTGIWKKENADRVYNANQLTLSNIKTSKHILDEINRDVSELKVIEGDIEETIKRSESISDKLLPGNIVEMVLNKGDPNSSLNKEPKKTKELVAHIVTELEEQGADTASLKPDLLESFLVSHDDQDFVDGLTVEDRKNLLEKVQKKNITDAFETEIERVKGDLEKDDEHLTRIKDEVSEEMAQRISSLLDADSLNSIIAGSKEEDDDEATLVKGGQDEKESAFNVHGSKIEKDGDKTIIHSSLTEEEDKITIHGTSEIERDGDKVTIKAGEITEEDDKVTFHGVGQEEDGEETIIKNITDNIDNKLGFGLSPAQKKEAGKEVENAFDAALESIRGDGGLIDFGAFMDKVRQRIGDSNIKPHIADEMLSNFEYSFSQIAKKQPGGLKELSVDYLQDFKKRNFSELVDDSLDKLELRDAESQDAIADYFKKRLQKKIASEISQFAVDENGKKRKLTDEDLQSEEAQEVLRNSIQSVFSNEWQVVTNKGDKFENLQDQILNSLGDVLPFDQAMLDEMARQSILKAQGMESYVIKQSLFDNMEEESFVIEDDGTAEEEREGQKEEQQVKSLDSYTNTALKKKAQQAEDTNKSLQKQIMDLKAELNAKNQALNKIKNQASTENSKTSEEISKEAKSITALNKRTEALKEKIAQDPSLSEEHKIEINNLLDREKRLISLTKKTEQELKKLQIENESQKSKFEDEATGLHKAIISKDNALKKAKDHLVYISKKKDKEIKDLSNKVGQLNQLANAEDATKASSNGIQELKQENLNLQKMVEAFKRQAESGRKSTPEEQEEDVTEDIGKFKNQIKSLSGVKNQLESKLSNIESQNLNLTNKLNDQSNKLNDLKKEKEGLLKELKRVGTQAGNVLAPVDEDTTPGLNQTQTKSTQSDVMKLQAQLNEEQEKSRDLANRAKMLVKQVQQNEKAVEQARELTVKESELRKKLFSSTKNLKILEDKLAKAEAGESKNDNSGKDVLRDRVELEKLREADNIKSKKIGLLEKELKKYLTETVEKANATDKKGDPIAELRSSEARLKMQLMESGKKISIYESKLRILEKQMIDVGDNPLAADSADSSDKASNLHQSINETKLKQELEKSRKHSLRLEDKISKLEKDLKGALSDTGPIVTDETSSKLQNELNESNKKLKTYEAQVKELKEDISKLESGARRDQVMEGKEQNAIESKHRSELLAADRKSSELSQRIKDLEKKVYQAEAAKAKAMEDVRRISNQNAQSKASSSSGGDEAAMKNELMTAQRKISLMEGQLKSFEKQAGEVNGKLESANNQIKMAQKQKEAAETTQKQEALTAKRQIQEYQNKYAEMEKKLKEVTGGSKGGGGEQVNMTRYKQMEANTKKLMGELSKAKNSAAVEKSTWTKLKAENTGLQNKIKVMEKEVEKARQAIAAMSKNGGRKAS